MMALLSSCNHVKQTVEITGMALQTVEVTIPIPKSTIASESGNIIASPDATAIPLSINIQTDLASIPMDPVFFDGLIVLTQYYTLLDQRAYEEAVSLYSKSRQNINGEEADIAYFQSSLESIEIRYIYPFDYWLAKQGQVASPNRQDEMRFVVGTTVVYRGAAWNDWETPVPFDRTNFILLVLENGKWKINEINSSPWFSKR